MAKLSDFERLQSWHKAKKLFELHRDNLWLGYFPHLYADHWHKRMRFDELMVLQSMGNEDSLDAWMILMAEGALERKAELIYDDRRPSNKYYYLVTPHDFADYLKQIGEQPSELIKVWFDVVGVEAVADDDDTASNEREYTAWLRDTWEKEGCLTGAPFFNALKKYKGKEEGSIVIDIWWSNSPELPGVILRTTTGSITLPKSQIQKIASKFRGEKKERENLSSGN